MGVAAYQRGSAAISESIERDYMENRGGYSKRLKEQMERAESRIEQLEQFCRDAQSLYIDVTYEDSAKGLLRGYMHQSWLKNRDTKLFKRMLERCNIAHCKWVDSNPIDVFNHLAVCKEKAKAWFDLITRLNGNNVKYSFTIPQLS
jgi:hypothetical protein